MARKLLADPEALDAISASNIAGGQIVGFAAEKPGTKAFDANAMLQNIKSRNFTTEIQQMRQESPTGGAVGNVAVAEMESFSNLPASLKVGLSRKLLEDQLKQLIRRSEAAQEKILKAYERDYSTSAPLREALKNRSVIEIPEAVGKRKPLDKIFGK